MAVAGLQSPAGTGPSTARSAASQNEPCASTSLGAEDLKGKERQRSQLGRSISRLQKSLKQTNPPWPEAERRKMDADLQELLKEMQRLDRELGVLNEHIRLLNIKRLLLRL